jgi:hypothetical protein
MADDKESEGISIGASAEAILCTGVWDDGVDNDFEPTNWVMATLQAPAVGGTLELKGEKGEIGGSENAPRRAARLEPSARAAGGLSGLMRGARREGAGQGRDRPWTSAAG